MEFVVIIPARLESTRLYGKMLLKVEGKSILEHTYDKAIKSKASRVIIATDSEMIAEEARLFNAEVCMTSLGHDSGTSRISEAVDILCLDANEVIVNVQGDEPMISPKVINQIAEGVHCRVYSGYIKEEVSVVTVCKESEDGVNVMMDRFGKALFFSRTTPSRYKHIGVYGYRAVFLRRYADFEVSPMEKKEKLEQLTFMYEGHGIYVELACEDCGFGIDTEKDYNNYVKSRKSMGVNRVDPSELVA